ncbi:MAG TPA: hypothetical protein VID47_04510 [Actinomycetota bacterium]
MGTALVIIGLVAVLIAAAWFGWWAKKKRRQELALAAKQLGLQYSAEDTFNCLGLPFGLLRRGDGRGTENVLWGAWQGMDLREFDYWYYDRTTDSKGQTSRTYYHFSCVVTEIPLTSPDLSVTKENIFTRFADHVGLRDIEFESEDFNRAFNVKSRDKKFANDVIDARMMQWLLESGEGWAFEMNGPYVLVYHKRIRPGELTPLLGSIKMYVEHIPKVAYSLYGDPARAAQLYGITEPQQAAPPRAAPPGGVVPPEGTASPPAPGPVPPPPSGPFSPSGGGFQP